MPPQQRSPFADDAFVDCELLTRLSSHRNEPRHERQRFRAPTVAVPKLCSAHEADATNAKVWRIAGSVHLRMSSMRRVDLRGMPGAKKQPHPRPKPALGISISSATQHMKSKDATNSCRATPAAQRPGRRSAQNIGARAPQAVLL